MTESGKAHGRLIRVIRNIALLMIAAIVVLAGVVAFSVITHGSRQLQLEAVPRAVVEQQGAAMRLSEAIQLRTVSSFENPDQDVEALRACRCISEKVFRRLTPL